MKKLQTLLYVTSIVVAVGIGMVQQEMLPTHQEHGSGCVGISSSLPCSILGNGCTGYYSTTNSSGNFDCTLQGGNQCGGGAACAGTVQNISCMTESGCH